MSQHAEMSSGPTSPPIACSAAAQRMRANAKAKQRKMALRRAQYAEIREIDRTIQLDSLAILEEVMRHFFWKARILEGMGTEGDFNEVDKRHDGVTCHSMPR
jgi:hypothetical protein